MNPTKSIFITFLMAAVSLSQAQDEMADSAFFQLESISINESGMLDWVSTSESPGSSFYIEQFRWNKWVKVGEVPGKGLKTNSYQFEIIPHAGLNKFRVRYGATISGVAEFMSAMPEAEPFTTGRKVDKELIFDAETRFEIYDAYGNISLKGNSKTIDVSALAPGVYYINFDNKSEKFIINRARNR